MDFLQGVQQFGVAIALVGVFFIPLAWFFIRRDQVREAKLGVRLDAREVEIRDAREAHIKDLRNIVINNTQAVQELCNTLRHRPCLYEQMQEELKDDGK